MAPTAPAPIKSDLLIHADVASTLADLYAASSSASMVLPTITIVPGETRRPKSYLHDGMNFAS